MLKQQERSLLQGPALVAAVKQKMKMKEIYLSKPPVLWTAAAKGSHNKSIRQALEEVNFSNLLVENGGL